MMDQIITQFNKVITASQCIDNPHTEKLFEDWKTNKQRFIDMFGGNLIYETEEEYDFHWDEDQKERSIENFLDYTWHAAHSQRLYNFLTKQKNGIFMNKVIQPYHDDNIDISEGVKLSKSLKYFIEDQELLNNVQTRLSRLIQEQNLHGKLVFSVHPLDYLSVSENCHNWHSCHALDGDYRSGNLNYMADPHTVICYIKSNEEYVLPHFPCDVLWNSKKWRMLFYVNDDNSLVFFGKQYPYKVNCEELLLTKIWGFINPTANWSPLKQATQEEMFKSTHEGTEFKMIKDSDHTHQFNDCLRSSCYTAHYSRDLNVEYIKPMSIGRPVKCMECGEHDIYYSEQMRCDECGYKYSDDYDEDEEEYGICSECGATIPVDDLYTYRGQWYCDNCMHEGSHVRICPRCGDIHPRDEMTRVPGEDEEICSHCAEQLADEPRRRFDPWNFINSLIL